MVNGEKTTRKTTEKNVVLAGPYPTKHLLLAGYRLHQLLGTTILAVPANREVVSGGIETEATQPVKVSPNGRYWYLFKLPPEITGKDIHESTVTARSDPNPEVTLGFTSHGARAFQAITKEEYERGLVIAGLQGSAGKFKELYAQHNAIVLDGRIQATPFIDYTDAALSLGISGAEAVINTVRSIHEANSLAFVLRYGSLPYRLELVSSKLCAR
jgi:preprotein translocase subunit SecD